MVDADARLTCDRPRLTSDWIGAAGLPSLMPAIRTLHAPAAASIDPEAGTARSTPRGRTRDGQTRSGFRRRQPAVPR